MASAISGKIYELFSHCPLAKLESCRSYICSHPLYQRVASDWKVLLMDCGTTVAVTGLVITFFTGSTLVCAAFMATSLTCGISSFYMRQFSTLTDLQGTAQGLREANQQLEAAIGNLATENQRLTASIGDLQRNNVLFEQSNQNFILANEQLKQQITHLALQIVHLRESAQRIRSEVVRFHQENNHLHANVLGFDQSLRVLDQQIAGSQALSQQITRHFTSQQQGLDQRLELLSRYLSELRADNRLHERIRELAALQAQVMQAATQLHEIQQQYTAERVAFETIRTALVQLKDQFDAVLRSNNQQFRDNVSALALERQRIHEMLNRFSLPAPTVAPGNNPVTAAHAHQIAQAPPSILVR